MSTNKGIKLTEQHLRLIYDTFVLLDDDKDGLIDKNQFFTLFRALGQTVSDAYLTKVFASAVAEEAKNAAKAKQAAAAAKTSAAAAAAPKKAAAAAPVGELVSYNEFINQFACNYIRPIKEEILINAFNIFDDNNDGKITYTKIHELLNKRGEIFNKKDIQEFITLAQLDHAKEIDYTLLAKRLVKGPAGIATIE